MTAPAPKPNDDKGVVLRFEPRRAPPRPHAHHDASPVADLKRYSERHGRDADDRDDHRHRMKANAAALVLVVALIWCGYWLFDTLTQMRRTQDCVLAGGVSCAPIKPPPTPAR